MGMHGSVICFFSSLVNCTLKLKQVKVELQKQIKIMNQLIWKIPDWLLILNSFSGGVNCRRHDPSSKQRFFAGFQLWSGKYLKLQFMFKNYDKHSNLFFV